GAGFIWLPAPNYGLPAGTTFFNLADVPDATSTWPYGINNSGVVVGQVIKRVFIGPPLNRYVNQNRAMIWRNGHLQGLNDLLPPKSGWTLIEADDVTPSGQIIGFGISPNSIDSNGHAFRMSAIALADMNCDGVVDGDDIEGFVLALIDPTAYAVMYPACNR